MKISKRLINQVMNLLVKSNTSTIEERLLISRALDEYEYFEGKNDSAIYKMDIDCGRMGNLQGSFVAEKKAVEWLLDSGLEIYFGEVLGKHSEIYGVIEKHEIMEITDDHKAVKTHNYSGYNPFDYTTLRAPEEWEDLTAGEIYEQFIKNK